MEREKIFKENKSFISRFSLVTCLNAFMNLDLWVFIFKVRTYENFKMSMLYIEYKLEEKKKKIIIITYG